jgi:hypothetical protein
LPAEFDGVRHPDALVSARALPADYAAAPASADEGGARGGRERRTAYFATAADILLALVAWMFVVGPLSGAAPAGLRALAWASIAPRFVLAGTVGGALTGCLLSVAGLRWLLLYRRRERSAEAGLLGVLVVVVAAGAFWGLGVAFPTVRPSLHEPTYRSLGVFWGLAWVASALLTWFKRDLRAGAALLALPMFAFFPTVYRYGSVAAMAPAWIGFLLCTLAVASRTSEAASVPSPFARIASSALAVAAPAVFLVPFLAADSSDYRFEEWKIYPSDVSPIFWIVGAGVAKVILLWPRSTSARVRIVGLSLATILVVFERVRLSTAELSCSVATLAFAGYAIHRRRSLPAPAIGAPDLERLAWIAGLLMMHHALTRAGAADYLWRDWLLAAVLLSGRVVRRFFPARERGALYAVLLFFAFLANGWVTFAWTVHRLEWGFLYEWFSAPFVERHVGFLLPLILARYLLPLIVARLVLAAELGSETPYPARTTWFFVGWKVVSLFLMTVGIGCTSPTTEIYLEGAEETAIAGVLSAALL